jgi:arylsulfatase A-like enzyme
LHPTVLELHGAPVPDGLTGMSLMPLLTGSRQRLRRYVFNGTQQGGKRVVQAGDGRWLYSYWTHGQRPPSLLDLKNDPAQTRNLARKHPDVCRKLHRALEKFDPSICRPGGKARL